MTCPLCAGVGSYQEPVMWSDGLGMATMICRVCRGTGDISASDLLAQLRRLDTAEKELTDLKTAAALYLTLTEKGRLPNPPLPTASNPAADVRVWRRELVKAACSLR